MIKKKEMKEKISAGIKDLHDKVAITMGPEGSTVMWFGFDNQPRTTKDGVTVARNTFVFEETIESIAASMLKDASIAVNDKVGDGTTSVIALSKAMWDEMSKVECNTKEILAGASFALQKIIEKLIHFSFKLETEEHLKSVLKVASNNEKEIIDNLMSCYYRDGKLLRDLIVTIEPTEETQTSIDLNIEPVYKIDRGYQGNYPGVDNKTKLEEPLVIIVNGKLTDVSSVTNLLQYAQSHKRSIAIFADDFSPNFVRFMAEVSRTVKNILVKTPLFGQAKQEVMEDMAAVYSAKIILVEHLATIPVDHIGSCQAIISDPEYTTSLGINIGLMSERAKTVEKQITNAVNDYERKIAKQRFSSLTGNAALIKVASILDSTKNSLKDQYDDAVKAVESAFRNKIVQGAGLSFLKARRDITIEKSQTDDWLVGYDAFLESLSAVTNKILQNANHSYYLNYFWEEEFPFKESNIDPKEVYESVEIQIMVLRTSFEVVSSLLKLGYIHIRENLAPKKVQF